MKYLRTYEQNSENLSEPKVGDYVVCGSEDIDHINKKIKFSIGKVKKIDSDIFTVIYDFFIESHINDFNDLETNELDTYMDEIEYFSSKKEDCEVYLNSKKYNL